MPFIPLPRGIKITIGFTLRGVPVSITFHVQAPDTVTTTHLANAAQIVKDWWDGTAYFQFSQDLVIQRIEATDVSTQPAQQHIITSFTHGTGNAAVDALPSNVAIVISNRTFFIGRSYRGRVYLPGIASNVVEDNVLTAGAKANLETMWGTLLTNLGNAALPMIIASYQNNLASRETAVATLVSNALVVDTVRTQRRRLGS